MNATIENRVTPVETSPTFVRHPRFDLYGPIHKAMRVVMSDMLVRIGKTNFANEGAATRLARDIETLLVWCEQHIEHEMTFIHPHVSVRLPQALASIDDGHEQHDRFVAELRGLLNGITSASTPELRVLAGRTLYLHYSAFFAETMVHMVEEEQVLQPLIHRFFTDEELLAMNGAIIAAVPLSEMFETLTLMVTAANGPERANFLRAVRAGAPPEAFQGFVTTLRPRLDADEWSELLGLCPFLG